MTIFIFVPSLFCFTLSCSSPALGISFALFPLAVLISWSHMVLGYSEYYMLIKHIEKWATYVLGTQWNSDSILLELALWRKRFSHCLDKNKK